MRLRNTDMSPQERIKYMASHNDVLDFYQRGLLSDKHVQVLFEHDNYLRSYHKFVKSSVSEKDLIKLLKYEVPKTESKIVRGKIIRLLINYIESNIGTVQNNRTNYHRCRKTKATLAYDTIMARMKEQL